MIVGTRPIVKHFVLNPDRRVIEVELLTWGRWFGTVRSRELARTEVRHLLVVTSSPVGQHWESCPSILAKGEDFILYAILDFIADNYLPVLEAIGEADWTWRIGSRTTRPSPRTGTDGSATATCSATWISTRTSGRRWWRFR